MSARNYKLITSVDELPQVVAALKAAPAVGLDTETTGLDPHTSRLRLLQLATLETTFIIDLYRFTPEQLAPLWPRLLAPQPIKIAHNAKFDAKFLLRHYNVRLGGIYDTYLASVLISAGNENDRHGLEAVAARYLDVQMDKAAQLSDWSGSLSAYQLEYAARDAQVLLPLRQRLQAKLEELDLLVTARLEFDCVLAVAALELAGVYVDAGRWRELIKRVRAEHDIITDELQRELAAGAAQMSLFGDLGARVNLDSPTQIKEALARLGISIEDTREWTLRRTAIDHPIVEKLLQHRGLSKSLSSYGENILEFINPATGRIHADFRQLGTPTGRLTTSAPSLQQIPHTVEYRSCFRAPEGRKLIIADYCVTKGTRIATTRGLLPIEEIEVGDQAYLEGGQTARIAALIKRGVLPVVTITLKNGYALTATELHRLRVLDGAGNYVWRRIGELQPTDFVVIQPGRGLPDHLPRPVLPPAVSRHFNNHQELRTPPRVDEQLATLLGYWAGDGSFDKGAIKWVVNAQDREVAVWLEQAAQRLFGLPIRSQYEYHGVIQAGLCSRPLLDWCAAIGAAKDRAPDFIWQSDPTIAAAYLRGLFEADGSVTDTDTGKISLASTRERLMREAQQLLLALGIPATLRKQEHTGPGQRFHCWTISVAASGVSSFSARIGFLSKRKRAKLTALLKRWTGKTVIGNMPNLQSKSRQLNLGGQAYRLLANTSSLSRPVSRALALTVEREYPAVATALGLQHITKYNQLFLPVIAIEPAGEQEVYDLSVPGPLTYLSNGFVSHNSQIEMRILADFSKDQALLDAFDSGADLHRMTAAQMYNLALDEVTPRQRESAKALNYGLVYGMGAEGLAVRIKSSVADAEALMKKYFQAYAGVARWLREAGERATREGRARTAAGRLWIFQLDPNDRSQASALRRIGKNAPIQGSSSDIFKRAMTLLDEALRGRDAQIVNSIHDELVVECDAGIAEEIRPIVANSMIAGAQEFLKRVPVSVDAVIADAWLKK